MFQAVTPKKMGRANMLAIENAYIIRSAALLNALGLF